jgi:hypothetical protein
VHAPDPVVNDANAWVRDVLGDVTHHLGSESIVAEEDVADTGYQYLGRDVAPVNYMRRIFM